MSMVFWISSRSTEAPMSRVGRRRLPPSLPRASWRGVLRAPVSLLAVPPLAHLIGPKGPQEIDLTESGPVDIDEVEFRVRELPQEEIRDPLFPARPKDQVRVREIRGVQPLREEFLVH